MPLDVISTTYGKSGQFGNRLDDDLL